MPDTYEKVSYKALQAKIYRNWVDSGLSLIDLSKKVGVKSYQTVKNSFHTEIQMVSDEVLTKVMDEINLKGQIVWEGGKKSYFIVKN